MGGGGAGRLGSVLQLNLINVEATAAAFDGASLPAGAAQKPAGRVTGYMTATTIAITLTTTSSVPCLRSRLLLQLLPRSLMVALLPRSLIVRTSY